MQFLFPRNLEGKLVDIDFDIKFTTHFPPSLPFSFPSFLFPFSLLGGPQYVHHDHSQFQNIFVIKKERKKTTHSLAVTSHFSSSLSTRQPLINLPFYVYFGHFLWMKSYNVWSFVMNSSHFFQSPSTVYMHQCIISSYCQIIFKCAQYITFSICLWTWAISTFTSRNLTALYIQVQVLAYPFDFLGVEMVGFMTTVY